MPKKGGKNLAATRKKTVSKKANLVKPPKKSIAVTLKKRPKKAQKVQPVSSRLLLASLGLGVVFAAVWFLYIPSPKTAYQQFLKQSLLQASLRQVYGSNDASGSEINGETLVDLKQNIFRHQAELTCHYQQNDGHVVTALLSYKSNGGTEYVRINSLDGRTTQAGDVIDLTSKYAAVSGKWFKYENDDLAHLTGSQLENQVIIGLANLSAPGVDQAQAIDAINKSGVFEIIRVEKNNHFRNLTYTLTIRTHRAAYIKMLETAVPLLGNRSEVINNIFGNQNSIDSVIGIRAVNSQLLYQTSDSKDQCTVLGAKLFGERIVGKAGNRPVASAPINSKNAQPVSMPRALTFSEYLKAQGLAL